MATKKTAYEAPTPASDKKKALQTAISQIEKNYGKGTVMRLGERPDMNVEAIPTGSLALDAALGVGGVPKGPFLQTRYHIFRFPLNPLQRQSSHSHCRRELNCRHSFCRPLR